MPEALRPTTSTADIVGGVITSPSAAQALGAEATSAATAKAVNVGRGRRSEVEGREKETKEERMANQSKSNECNRQRAAGQGTYPQRSRAQTAARPHAPRRGECMAAKKRGHPRTCSKGASWLGRGHKPRRTGRGLCAGPVRPETCQARWAGGGSLAAKGQRRGWAEKVSVAVGSAARGGSGTGSW